MRPGKQGQQDGLYTPRQEADLRLVMRPLQGAQGALKGLDQTIKMSLYAWQWCAEQTGRKLETAVSSCACGNDAL